MLCCKCKARRRDGNIHIVDRHRQSCMIDVMRHPSPTRRRPSNMIFSGNFYPQTAADCSTVSYQWMVCGYRYFNQMNCMTAIMPDMNA